MRNFKGLLFILVVIENHFNIEAKEGCDPSDETVGLTGEDRRCIDTCNCKGSLECREISGRMKCSKPHFADGEKPWCQRADLANGAHASTCQMYDMNYEDERNGPGELHDLFCSGYAADFISVENARNDGFFVWEICPECGTCQYVDPTVMPSSMPSKVPSQGPSFTPSLTPSSDSPSYSPSYAPSFLPSQNPSLVPTVVPTDVPSHLPSKQPSTSPTVSSPTNPPTLEPSQRPSTTNPSTTPSELPSQRPSIVPSNSPSKAPSTTLPSHIPSISPSESPSTTLPTKSPSTTLPTRSPTTTLPTKSPTTTFPTKSPTTTLPTKSPTTTNPTVTPSFIPSDLPITSSPTPEPSKNTRMITLSMTCPYDLETLQSELAAEIAKINPNVDVQNVACGSVKITLAGDSMEDLDAMENVIVNNGLDLPSFGRIGGQPLKAPEDPSAATESSDSGFPAWAVVLICLFGIVIIGSVVYYIHSIQQQKPQSKKFSHEKVTHAPAVGATILPIQTKKPINEGPAPPEKAAKDKDGPEKSWKPTSKEVGIAQDEILVKQDSQTDI